MGTTTERHPTRSYLLSVKAECQRQKIKPTAKKILKILADYQVNRTATESVHIVLISRIHQNFYIIRKVTSALTNKSSSLHSCLYKSFVLSICYGIEKEDKALQMRKQRVIIYTVVTCGRRTSFYRPIFNKNRYWKLLAGQEYFAFHSAIIVTETL